jgi:predicted TIM-barrel fold metal-dependent hydrolase
MAQMNQLQDRIKITSGRTGRVTFLPEPERSPRKYTVISVDDHIVEPRDMFEGRFPTRLADRAPRVIEKDGGHVWIYEGKEFPNVGFSAVVGRPVEEFSWDPTRFEDMRRGAWDVHARIADMDISGVYASLAFPSALAGFAGQRIQLESNDAEVALAAVQAWNDWNIEDWSGAYPDRLIPCQLPYYLDPEIGAQEIYKNAERGFKAVSFCEAPHAVGLPSLHTGHWDPIMRACEETETVINLHVGSGSTTQSTSEDAPGDVIGVLFFGNAILAAVDWLYSMLPVKYPNLKIALSEGGIGWVPALVDRLNHMLKYHDMYGTWTGLDQTPAEVFLRNFYFCALDDPSTFALLDVIGVDHIMVEEDYPHPDSSWPRTQQLIEKEIGALPPDVLRKVTWENASRLYRHEVPKAVQDDPNAF